MQDFNEKVAFVTGAASGIGLAITKSLIRRGCHVMMADIDMANLEAAQASLPEANGKTIMIKCDVTNAEDIKVAADKTVSEFGKVHFVFNNAGVAIGGQPGRIALKDWQWIVDINLMGVVHGVETFVPLIASHGEGGHIVNTASMAGHATMAGMSPYHATKFAVVGYSECLRQELARANIGVSVLCPTWVKTSIHTTGTKRPSAGSGESANDPVVSNLFQTVKGLVENGISPDVLAELVMKSIEANRLYIFNDPEARASIDIRREHLQADYAACLEDLGLS